MLAAIFMYLLTWEISRNFAENVTCLANLENFVNCGRGELILGHRDEKVVAHLGYISCLLNCLLVI